MNNISHMHELEKPAKRGTVRQKLGKEYFILKKNLSNLFTKKQFSCSKQKDFKGHVVFQHHSVILRRLKDVDMYLQENKRTNLGLAIKRINNIIIKPGETFSVWRLLGRPTARKGYLEGLIINQGKIQKGTGGGLCQLSNLLYWMFAHSPITITERHRHSFDVFPDSGRTVPFGAGATISYNYIDLQVKNPTKMSFQIVLWLDEIYLNGKLLCSEPLHKTYEIEERNHCFKQQLWGGYSRHNQIFRIETDKYGNKEEQLLAENHALLMYAPFLGNNNP